MYKYIKFHRPLAYTVIIQQSFASIVSRELGFWSRGRGQDIGSTASDPYHISIRLLTLIKMSNRRI